MSEVIDEKVVSIEFNNGKFEKDIDETIKSLKKLDEATKIKPDKSGFDIITKQLSGLTDSVNKCAENITDKFSIASVSAITAISRFTNTAIDKIERFTKALTIEPVSTGLSEYEQKLDSVQTILANTRKEGTKLEDVNKVLDELNKYADKTIYNFQQMTYNIGTFTAAGVHMQDSADAIQGIANLAAVSGANAQKASMAMYQMSQALASGSMKLQDWNSMVNAGIGGKVFQDALMNTAEALGVQNEDFEKLKAGAVSFRESLKGEWISSDVLTKTLAQFTMAAKKGSKEWEEYSKTLKSWGFKDDQIEGILEMANTAEEAATKVKTFTQLVDTMKEAVQSGWAQTWEIVIGDFEEAKILWTKVSNWFDDVSSGMSDARNGILREWKDLGGRTVFLNAIADSLVNISKLLAPIRKAFKDVIPPITGKSLFALTLRFRKFSKQLGATENQLLQSTIYNSAKAIAMVFQLVETTIIKLIKGFFNLTSDTQDVASGFLEIVNAVALAVQNFINYINKSKVVDTIINTVVKDLGILLRYIGKVVLAFGQWVAESKPLSSIASSILDIWDAFKKMLGSIFNVDEAMSGTNDTFDDFKATLDKANPVLDKISKAFRKFADFIISIFDKIGKDPKKVLDDIVDGITNFSSNMQKGVMNLSSNIKGGVEDLIANVPNMIKNLLTKIKSGIEKFFNVADSQGIAAAVSTGTKDLNKGIFDSINDFGANLKSALGKFIDILTGGNEDANKAAHGFLDGLFGTFKYVSDSIKRLLDLITDTVTKADWINILETAFKFYLLYNLIESITNISEAISKVILSFNGLILELKNLVIVVKQLAMAKLIQSIAIAIVGLAASIAALTLMWHFDEEATKAAMIAVTVMLGAICLAMVNLAKTTNVGDLVKVTGYLLALSTALVILSAAIGVLAQVFKDKDAWDRILDGFVVLGGFLAGLILLSKLAQDHNIVALAADPTSPKTILGNLISIAGGLLVFAFALDRLSRITWGDDIISAAGKIVSLVVAIAAIGAAAFFSSKVTNEAGLSILAMAVSLWVLAHAIEEILKISSKIVANLANTWPILLAVSGALVGIAFLARAITNNAQDQVKWLGLTILSLAASIYIMSKAAQDLSKVDDIALLKSLGIVAAMAAIIGGLAVAINLTSKNTSDPKNLGKNILYIAGAIGGLAILVEVLAYLPDNDIKKGLIVVGAMGLLMALIIKQAQSLNKNTGPILAFLGGIIGLFFTLKSIIEMSKTMNTSKLIVVLGGLSLVMFTFSRVVKAAAGIKNTKGTMKVMLSLLGFVMVMAGLIVAISNIPKRSLSSALVVIVASVLAVYSLTKLAKAVKSIGRAEETFEVALNVMRSMMKLLIEMFAMFMIASNFTGSITNGIAALTVSMVAIYALTKLSKAVKDVGRAEATFDKAIKIMFKMEALLGVMGGIFLMLSNLTGNLVQGIVALGVIELAIEGLVLLSKSAKGLEIEGSAVKALIVMTGVVVVLSTVVELLSEIPIEKAAMGAAVVVIMTGVLGVITALMYALSKIDVDMATIGKLGVMTAIVVALSGLIIGLSTLMTTEQVDNAMMVTKAVSQLMLTIAATMLVMAVVCKVAENVPVSAIKGVAIVLLAVVIVIGVVMLLGAILGYLDEDWMNHIINGINNLNAVLGAVVTGIANIAASFVDTAVNSIADSIQSFVDKLQGIADSFVVVMDTFSKANPMGIVMAKQMGELLLILTAGSLLDSIDSFLSFFTGGKDFDTLSGELVSYAQCMSAFNAELAKTSDWSPLKETIEPARALADIANNLPKSGGILDNIFGSSDMEKFGDSLVAYGNGLKSYYNSVSGIEDWGPVEDSIPPAEALAKLSDSIPKSDGWATKIMGESNMETFGNQLSAFGESLVKYYNSVSKVTDWKPVDDSIPPASKLSDLSNSIPTTGGWASKIMGESDIETFGKKLVAFAGSLITFRDKVQNQSWTPLDGARDATSKFIELAGKLPSSEGVFSFFTGDTIDFEDFGEDLEDFGGSLVKFALAVGEITDWSVITDAIKPTEDLIKIAGDLSAISSGDFSSACTNLGYVYTAVANVANKGNELVSNISTSAISAMVTLFDGIAAFISEVSKYVKFDPDKVITFLNRFTGEILPKLNEISTDTDIQDVYKFANILKALTENIGHFGRLYDVLGNESVNKVAGTLKLLVGAFTGMNNINADSVQNFIDALKAVGEDSVKELAKALVNESGLLELSNSIDSLFETAAGTQEQKQSLLDSYAELGKAAGQVFADGLEGKDVTESITKLLPQGTKVVADEAAKTAEEATEKTQKTVKEATEESTTKGMADAATEIVPNIVNTVKNGVQDAIGSGIVDTVKEKLGIDVSSLKSFGLGGSSADIARQNAMAEAAGVDVNKIFELPEELKGLPEEKNLFGYDPDEYADLTSDPYGFGKNAKEKADEILNDQELTSNLLDQADEKAEKNNKKKKKIKKKVEKLIAPDKKYFRDYSKDTVKGNLERYVSNVDEYLGPGLEKAGKKFGNSTLKTAKIITKATNKFTEGLYLKSDQYKEDVAQVEEHQKKILKLQKAYEKARTNKKKNAIYKELREEAKALGQSYDDVIKHANEGIKELKDTLYENFKNYTNPFSVAIENVTDDIFAKAERGTRTSFYRLSRNIGSQIEAAENYKKLLTQLRKAGYSEDVVNEVKEKGITEGSQIAKALLQAGKEDVKKYNKQYEKVKKLDKKQWLSDVKSKAENAKKYTKLMDKAAEMGFSQDVLMEIGSMGIEEGLAYLEMLTTMSEKEKDKVNKYYKRSAEASKKEANSVIGAYTYAGDESLKALYKSLNTKKSEAIGKNVCEGLVIGMQKNMSKVTKEAKEVGLNVAEALKSVLKINSPSKITEDFGEFLDEGLAIGVDKNAAAPVNSIEDMGNTAVKGMSGIMSTMDSLINGSGNLNPTVKPELDVSSLKKGMHNANSLLSSGLYAMSVSADVASRMNSKTSKNNKAKDSNSVYNFVQNNYSPEPLNREKIYKDTRELIKKQQRTVTI